MREDDSDPHRNSTHSMNKTIQRVANSEDNSFNSRLKKLHKSHGRPLLGMAACPLHWQVAQHLRDCIPSWQARTFSHTFHGIKSISSGVMSGMYRQIIRTVIIEWLGRHCFLIFPSLPHTFIEFKANSKVLKKQPIEYNQELKEHFQLKGNEKPRFDVILLGMGPDGHTASLFPGTSAVHETEQCVVAPWVEKFETYRITLTPPVLNEAENIIFLVTGSDKAETLKFVLEAAYQPDLYPAQIVQPTQGRLLWLVDQAAGNFLSPSLLSTP